MISKAKATKGSAAAIDYIMKEEKQSFELYLEIPVILTTQFQFKLTT